MKCSNAPTTAAPTTIASTTAVPTTVQLSYLRVVRMPSRVGWSRISENQIKIKKLVNNGSASVFIERNCAYGSFKNLQ